MAIPRELQPPDQYREMAQACIANANGIHEYLNACEATGLPIDAHRAELNSIVEFHQKFLRNFFPDA